MSPRAGPLLFVLGAGGHGKVVAEAAIASGWNEVRLLDDRLPSGQRVGSWFVAGPFPAALDAAPGAAAIVAVGDNALRIQWIERFELAGVDNPVLISPHAVVSPMARIGAGTVILPGAIVAADARIGRGCILNHACSVDHDCVLGDGVHVSPGARLGGGVQVGARSWIGIGASIRHEIVIGADSIVGAGAAVMAPVADRTTVVGVPARPVESTAASRRA